MTKLFSKSDSRGIDAAGYWGTENGVDGSVAYHKEPGRSSFFVQKPNWKELENFEFDLLLLHARGASKGMGEPFVNKNNHPFTSLNKSIALVHNGKIDDNEYKILKCKYSPLSQCDSEILLRIFEAGELYSNEELEAFSHEEYPQRLAGIRDIFSLINLGHMAVAVGERVENGDRILWLFRNQHRPLWLIDVRELLGQILFVSEPSIWEDAISELPQYKKINKSARLIELPPEEIWQFKTSVDQPCPTNIKRYAIERQQSTPWQFDGKKINPLKKDCKFKIKTKLDDNDKLVFQSEEEKDPFSELHIKCNNIIEVVNKIRFSARMMIQQNLMTDLDLEQLLSHLEEHFTQLDDLSKM